MLSAPISTSGAVFLSYAREDAAAARRIADALRAFGVEVWFDQHELRGGDQWDQKIRQQVRECALFIPIISGTTEGRREGYFRREWKLAAERTHDMGKRAAFLVPVVIDGTAESRADVPDEFLRVQWTRLANGVPSPGFVEQVKRLLTARPDTKSETAGSASNPQLTRAVSAAATARSAAPRRVALAVLMFIALAAGSVAVWKFGPRSFADASGPRLASAPASAPVADSLDKSVAVLPFANLSGDPAQEYFSDGMTEEILNALARERDLRVPGRASVFAFKEKRLANADIARALNVSRLVEGSVRRAGNQIRVTVTLWRASDGHIDALPTIQQEMTGTAELFALQDLVAGEVVKRLTRRSRPISALATTASMEAYDLYLRARVSHLSAAAPGLYEARRQLEEAVRLDPEFAPAWVRLAEIAAILSPSAGGGFDGDPATRRRAVEAANRAVQLAPELAEARVARAYVHLNVDEDLEAVERELREAERLQPLSADLARVRAMLEAARDAASPKLADLVAVAVARDPENPRTLFLLARLLTHNGQFARADELFRRSIAIGRAQTPYYHRGANWIAWTGEIPEAIAIAESCPVTMRNEIFYRNLAVWHEQAGNMSLAHKAWEKARELAESEVQSPGIKSAHAQVLMELANHARREGNEIRAKELFATAKVELEPLLRAQPDNWYLHLRRIRWHQLQGQTTEALAALEDAAKLSRAQSRQSPLLRQRAELLASTDRKDEAVDCLRRLHDAGYAFGYQLRVSVDLKPLHGHVGFLQLMRDAEARANAIPRPAK